MKKIIITGSSGFIGTNLALSFRSDFDVYAIDRNPPRVAESGVNYVSLDLLDFERSSEIISEIQPEFVVHMAARTDLRGQYVADYKDNTDAVENLCKILSNLSCVEKAVFASSMLVCEAGHVPISADEYSFTTPYGESKALGEKIVAKYSDLLPKSCIVRPTSIWGPYFGEPYRNFFEIVRSGRFFFFGSICAKKTYGYVGNTVRQVRGLIEDDSWKHMSVYYLGDEDALSIDEFARIIIEVGGYRTPIALPYPIVKSLAYVGDFLSMFGLRFPMTSFRLKNIGTENVFQRMEVERFNRGGRIHVRDGVKETIEWLDRVARE